MNKRLVVFAIVAAVAVGAIVLAKDVIARAAVTGGVKAMTGLNLHIRSMDVGLLRSVVGIRGLTLENPSGFTDRIMIDLPEIYVHYDLSAFLRQQIHLREVRLELKEFVVVKDQQKRLNLDVLKVVQQSKEQPSKVEKPKGGKAPEIQIDLLQLKIGKVVYKDYSGGGSPKVQEFSVNIDERYENITNAQAFGALVVSRALMNTAVARLANVNLDAMQSLVGDQMGRATQAVTGVLDTATGRATDVGHGVLDTAEEAAKTATDTLKKVLPFGGK